MESIKIFIAKNKNLESYVLDNSFFISKELSDNESINFMGKEIENKVLRELALQYWVYHNCESDYVGLMKYNKLLSFKNSGNNENKVVPTISEKYMSDSKLKIHGITEINLDTVVNNYDIIKPINVNVTKLGYKNANDYYMKREEVYNTQNFSFFIRMILEKYPEYTKNVSDLLKCKEVNFHNIFIMRKDVYVKYSNLVFDIVGSLTDEIDKNYTAYEQNKDYSVFAAFLLNLFCISLDKSKTKILEVPIVEFGNVEIEEEWKPMYDTNNVALVLSSSDYYVPYLATMIKSIIDNASINNNYDINVLENGISKINKMLVKSMAEGNKNISIRFYNVGRKMDGIDLKAGGHISVETYFRLLIPEIFKKYNKVLFLDSDMTVHTDIAELFYMDVEGYTVAAAFDQCIAAFYNGSDKSFYPYCKNVLKLENHHDYFQAGVMLLNLRRFRERYTKEEIFAFATSRQFTYVDQDIMNSLCRGEVKHLNLEWNVFPDMGNYTHKFMPDRLRKEYENARENIKICHHTGPVKPWNNPGADMLMTYKFWSIAKTTPFYEIMTYRLNHAVAYEYSKYNKKPSKIRKIVKEKMLMPIFNLMFPKGKTNRKKFKRMYFKIRGWELPTWDLGDVE